MQHEFDNTIDALLRDRARNGETVSNENSGAESFHFEADEIAAFAENVLPSKTRARYVEHFADCADCRRILSTFMVTVETEDELEISVSEPSPVQTKTSWNDWFAGLFKLPNLGYAMAALTVLLIGSFVFIALRAPQQQPEIAAKLVEPEEAEKTAKNKRPAAQPAQRSDEPEQTETVAQAPAEPTPTDAATPLPEFTPEQNTLGNLPVEPPGVRITRNQANGNAAEAKRQTETARDESRGSATANTATTAQSPANPRPAESQIAMTAPSDAEREAGKPKPSVLAGQNQSSNDKEDDAVRSEAAEKVEGMDRAERSRTATAGGPPNLERATATQVVGGKTFLKRGGVWTDSSYRSQATTNIARGSNEFKNLDAGLRSIAGNLSGTIIVVWNGKAYRIN